MNSGYSERSTITLRTQRIPGQHVATIQRGHHIVAPVRSPLPESDTTEDHPVSANTTQESECSFDHTVCLCLDPCPDADPFDFDDRLKPPTGLNIPANESGVGLSIEEFFRLRTSLFLASSKPSLTISSKTAWVSHPATEPQLLFIRRTTRPSDRYSSHIAFPGGRHEPTDESSHYTALRYVQSLFSPSFRCLREAAAKHGKKSDWIWRIRSTLALGDWMTGKSRRVWARGC